MYGSEPNRLPVFPSLVMLGLPRSKHLQRPRPHTPKAPHGRGRPCRRMVTVDLSGVARAVYEINSPTDETPNCEPRNFSMGTLLYRRGTVRAELRAWSVRARTSWSGTSLVAAGSSKRALRRRACRCLRAVSHPGKKWPLVNQTCQRFTYGSAGTEDDRDP